jgi:tRNA(Ile)-lysidine synthase
VRFEDAVGEGFAALASEGAQWHFAPRAGGERIRLDARRPTRTLKNLLQEAALPAWERERLPLLFDDTRLVWVPGVGIAADYACPPGARGLRPCWRVAGKAPLC